MNDLLTNSLVSIMKKINTVTDSSVSMSELLEDVCKVFDFACGFIYQADYNSIFHIKDFYQSCEFDNIAEKLDLKATLGEELLKTLTLEKVIIFSEKSIKTPLQEKLSDIFSSNSLILIPIKDQNVELIAMIGLVDRRGFNRQVGIDLNNSYIVLSLLANKIQLEMSQTRTTNAEKALNNVLDHVGIDIYVNDYHSHDILYVNKSMALPYGGVDNMVGKKCWDVIFTNKTEECEFCPQPKLVDKNGDPNNIYSWDYQRPFDGSWFRVLSSAFPWSDGRLAHLVASVNITESKQNELLVQNMANYDYLTGIANRRKLLNDMEDFIIDKSLIGNSWYMLFCDLDGFKQINDTAGHRAGDNLLKAIGTRLQTNPIIDGKSYRHGGDEFIILLPDKWTSEQSHAMIQNLMNDFTSGCEFENNKMSCGCSIGVVHFPSDGKTSEELIHRADIAMYAAKDAGKNVIRFYNKGDIVTGEDYFK